MRNRSGLRTFLLGTGIGIVAGIAVTRLMKANLDQGVHDETSKQPEIKLEKEEIAQFAQQFLNIDDKKTSAEPIH